MKRVELWRPSVERVAGSEIRRYQTWLEQTRGISTDSYDDLHAWSIADIDSFWESIWEYFSVIGDRSLGPIRSGNDMVNTRWFAGTNVNYAENLLKQAEVTPDAEAIVGIHESAPRTSKTWRELRQDVGSLAAHLRSLGVEPGDTVCAVLPSIPDAVTALLSVASIGAVWSLVNTDFGVDGIADRFTQLQPKVLITVNVNEFAGQVHEQLPLLPKILGALPSVRNHILIETDSSDTLTGWSDSLTPERANGDTSREGQATPVRSVRLREILAQPQELEFATVEFSHPLWVLYSSGTTGKPKGIVHSHGGIVLETLKSNGLQYDICPGDRVHFAVSTTWVVWNMLVDSMMRGATIVTYDGSPTYPRVDRHLLICSDEDVSMFGTGAAILSRIERSGVQPRELYSLDKLRSILSTGSPLPASAWEWVYGSINSEIRLGSDSGGTDIASGILGSNPLDPVYVGELQGSYLGVDARTVREDGEAVEGEVGELVIAQPLPSMPVKLWNDPTGEKYRSAYFDDIPGMWRQGDWATKVPDGGYVLHGRSDATINRGGIRMGSADICHVVDTVPGVQASMVIGAELEQGDYFMPLFVVPDDEVDVDNSLREAIIQAIRTRLSPRYVPDEVIEAPAVPKTRTGKLMEIPIKRIFQGADPSAVSRTAAEDPKVLEWYLNYAYEFARSRTPNANPYQS
ncbi:acetoacetate--CoA ligase [Brevibacterium sp. ZH18]|uniref:acetoacetate--CoA ligase n=1 Tax=Brevibacterium sp. ZH18 TaxID=2927784 RepID=UPI001F605EA3|nr:acetoacetate--CoA ligase [Brevibacterium sp. ZH18]MCI4011152.1 acetoacetate--CoA ligase [Brevibacterium sp. ZH18]